MIDRISLELPQVQQDLIAAVWSAARKVVLVIVSGSAVPFDESAADAVVYAMCVTPPPHTHTHPRSCATPGECKSALVDRSMAATNHGGRSLSPQRGVGGVPTRRPQSTDVCLSSLGCLGDLILDQVRRCAGWERPRRRALRQRRALGAAPVHRVQEPGPDQVDGGTRASTSFWDHVSWIAQPYTTPPAACGRALLGGHADGMLTGACDPMVWPIHVFRTTTSPPSRAGPTSTTTTARWPSSAPRSSGSDSGSGTFK